MSRPPTTSHLSFFLTPASAPEPSYIFSLASLSSALAALTSTSALTLLSPLTLQPTLTIPTLQHTLLAAHTPQTLLTTGSNGKLTLHDPRAPNPTTNPLRASAPIASLAVSPTGLIATGSEYTDYVSTVSLWDIRAPTVPVREYKESHNDDITALAFSPSGDLLVSGGTDGAVNVFSPGAEKGAAGVMDDEVDGALRTTINHGSVHRVGFTGDGAVWALSHDEVLGVYGDAGEGDTWLIGDVRPKMGAEYVVDVVGGEWVVGGNKEGEAWVDFARLGKGKAGWEVGSADGGFRLAGGHGAEVCRCVVVDSVTNTIFTGGEDGIVKAWKSPMGDANTLAEEMEVEADSHNEDEKRARKERKREKRKKKERKEKKKEDKKKRFNPY